MIVDFRRNPLQHCDCSGVIQVPGHHNFSGPEVGHHIESIVKKAQQRLYFLRQLRKFNLPQELLIQFYSAIIESVPLHVNNCLVQLSYQIWPQKTTEGSPDCWANHWYNPPHSPRTVLIQSEQKGWQNHSGPLTSSTLLFELLPSGRRYRALSTRTTRHRNSFFPQAVHLMTLDINVEHTTLFTLFIHHTYLFFHF